MTNKQNAKYAFYYLLSLVALIFMAISVGLIAFGIIDKTVPDALNSYVGNSDGQLKFAISALIIAAPIFYFLSGLIFKGLRKNEIDKDSGVRRWLTYLIILVSSFIILGVFIGIINNFLSGELTSRFVLKAASIFVLAAAVFSFYFYDIKREDMSRKDLTTRLFFYISLALVIAAFISAFFFVESPKTARARRLDQIVVNNISSLESGVNTYYDRYQKLPDSIDQLTSENNFYLDPGALSDPETKTPIVYEKLNDKDFQFCATFRTDSLQSDNGRGQVTYSMPVNPSSQYHGTGYQCLRGNLWNVIKADATMKTPSAAPIVQ
ncbi:MAG: DUF5671 domain-containing protein [Patescibacteria group bacterium]